jgi:hypothetical protein
MASKLRARLTYGNVIATLALFLVLSGGIVYAADTIGSSDVIDESLLSQDIKNGEIQTQDLSPLAGQHYFNRREPAVGDPTETLLTIPRLGQLVDNCSAINGSAEVSYQNTSNSDVHLFWDRSVGDDGNAGAEASHTIGHALLVPTAKAEVAIANKDFTAMSTIEVGRKTGAKKELGTFTVSAAPAGNGCIFQVQGVRQGAP